MTRIFLTLVLYIVFLSGVSAQDLRGQIRLSVKSTDQQPLPRATVELHHSKDSALLRSALTDDQGRIVFNQAENGSYFLRISMINYRPYVTTSFEFDGSPRVIQDVILEIAATGLDQVVVTAKKPFVQLMADKTVVNVEAGITNTGASVLEVLEKSPGVTVDRDGNISLKGKQNVLILVDGKQTYLPASEIAQMLGGMSAAQVDQLEIMENPPSKYDAAGNAGVINIRTKKIRQRGFNGNFSTSYGQGHYYKNNNSLALNFRKDNINIFFTYSSSFNQNFTNLDAIRTYYEPGTKNATAMLNQDGWLTNELQNHTLRTGMDINLSKTTTIGFAVSALAINRAGNNEAISTWGGSPSMVDSTTRTASTSKSKFRNAGGNINFRHVFGKDKELSADVDYLNYDIRANQFFENVISSASPYTERLRSNLPSSIEIFSGKIDYHQRLAGNVSVDAGYKSSFVNTDNLADYFLLENATWKPDYEKTNHFLYKERIHALYVATESNLNRVTMKAGLRYENTSYDAHQMGNPMRKDSVFDRRYDGLFPTVFVQYKADSNNSFGITAGRRIDRPAYQKLNPFVFVINKYTWQLGNPFFQPQYTWNVQASHQFKQLLTTSINYSLTTNYFSQIFLQNPDGILIYSEGNLGRMRNIGISVSTQVDVTKWWSINGLGNLYNKKIEGVVVKSRRTALTQFNMNLGNQFRFSGGWSAELSGFFVTKEQELQEITDPTGQIMVGVGKQVLKNKGSVKLNLRDVFYTQAMKGDTDFENAFEYFKLTRDTRVLTVAFSYRFGKSFKTASKRTGAGEEMERVGTGG